MNSKLFSFRFDIDSLADIEIGVPRLIELSKDLDARFTFFVNMGKSFNMGTFFRRQEAGGKRQKSTVSTIKKLGLSSTIRTVVFNSDIGLSHKKILFRLLDQGHELGLHGGMDHPLWQWELGRLNNKVKINEVLKPAYDHFVKLFGEPNGFASPGFKYNRYVLELMDDYGFEYASDMDGEEPFIPEGFNHLQLPVNVIGPNRIPLVEHLHVNGVDEMELLNCCTEEVCKRDLAVMYGHPAFEGCYRPIEELLKRVKSEGYGIVPLRECASTINRKGE